MSEKRKATARWTEFQAVGIYTGHVDTKRVEVEREVEIEFHDAAPAAVEGEQEFIQAVGREVPWALGHDDDCWIAAVRRAYRRLAPKIDVASLRQAILQWERDCPRHCPPDDHDFRRLDSILSRHAAPATAKKVDIEGLEDALANEAVVLMPGVTNLSVITLADALSVLRSRGLLEGGGK